MKALMGLLMALVAGALMLPGGARATGAPAPTAALAAITATVQVGPASAPFSFVPGTTVVDVGDAVHWNWNSPSTFHSVTSGTCSGFTCTPDGKFDSGAPQTAPANFDFTFSTPGAYPYFCKVHLSEMTGTILVASTRVYLPLVVR
jgi:plastocyanin